MSEPTELEIKIAERLVALDERREPVLIPIDTAERNALHNLLDELVERRLRHEYLGRASIESREERID